MWKASEVLITGASRGIGRAIALQFASSDKYKDCRLHLIALRNRAYLRGLCEEINAKASGKAQYYLCDVSDHSQVKKLFEIIPCPDILINNAGTASYGLIQDLDPREWSRIIDTNLSSAFFTAKCAIPGMLNKGRGCIINISSVWGIAGASMECAYSASKGGLNALTRALAKELAPSGIAVNALACGFIDTDMNALLSDEERRSLTDQIPAGRAGSPSEVARFVELLAQAPSYLTGQLISFDGGWQIAG